MTFSIIVTAHNSEKYIRNALKSIRQQLFKDYELIVVCNDCQDNTRQVAEQFADRVYECNHPNCTKTHNIGIDNAKGDYILFVHDDDWLLHPLALDLLSKHLTADIVCYGFIFGDYGFKRPLDNGGVLFPAVWNKAWKRETIGDIRFPDMPGPGEDLAFTRLVFNDKTSFMIWDEPLYFYNYIGRG